MDTLKSEKILIIAATHGNEPIGVDVSKILKNSLGKERKKVDFIIANPRAYRARSRFLEVDLNRVYPGTLRSKRYEERRAAQIYKLAQCYKYIIDIHQLFSGRDNLIVVPRRQLINEELINKMDVKKVVFWPSTSGRPTGPLAQFFDNCLELEIATGVKPYRTAVKDAASLLQNFIKNLDGAENLLVKKDRYLVYGRLLASELNWKRQFQDFKKTKVKQETFYPLLVNQYREDGIICYKTKKIVL